MKLPMILLLIFGAATPIALANRNPTAPTPPATFATEQAVNPTPTAKTHVIRLVDGYAYANLYSQPDNKSAVLNRLVDGDAVELTGIERDGFRQTRYQSQVGWLVIR